MRIAALSDQHGFLPEIPACDLLIIGGDICPDRIEAVDAQHAPQVQLAWFKRRVRPWLAASPAPRTIATWGNHDWGGAAPGSPRGPSRYGAAGRLDVLVDEAVHLVNGATVWATPWSNAFGDWAFMRPPAELAGVYAQIPTGIDILVSHQPPHGYGDEQLAPEVGARLHLGSRELLRAIERIRPRLVICGHIHAGHGRYVHQGIPIVNVSVVDEDYRLAHPVTLIDLPGLG